MGEPGKPIKVASIEEARRLSEAMGEIVEYEIVEPSPQTFPQRSQKRIVLPKVLRCWKGKISKHVEALIYLNGLRLSDDKSACRCGKIVNLSEIVDETIGTRLRIAKDNLEKKIQWTKDWNANGKGALAKKITLDKFQEKQIRLWTQYNEKDWGGRDVSFTTIAICPKCQLNLGDLTVTLRVVNAPEAMDLTKPQLIGLEASNGMLAYVSKRMRFKSIEELKAWRDYEDANQAKAILQKTVIELNELDLPYETTKITGTLTVLITEIEAEIHGRKIEFIDAVEKVMKERVIVIK